MKLNSCKPLRPFTGFDAAQKLPDKCELTASISRALSGP